MELSIFLAKLIGLYFIIAGGIMALRKDVLVPIFEDVVANKGFLVLSGVFNLVIGLAIAIGHPVWVWSWPLLITLLGYYAIAKGVLELGFPEYVRRIGPTILQNHYWTVIVVVLVLGIFLTYFGFVA